MMMVMMIPMNPIFHIAKLFQSESWLLIDLIKTMMNNWQSFCTSVLKIVMGLCKNVSENRIAHIVKLFLFFPRCGFACSVQHFQGRAQLYPPLCRHRSKCQVC